MTGLAESDQPHPQRRSAHRRRPQPQLPASGRVRRRGLVRSAPGRRFRHQRRRRLTARPHGFHRANRATTPVSRLPGGGRAHPLRRRARARARGLSSTPSPTGRPARGATPTSTRSGKAAGCACRRTSTVSDRGARHACDQPAPSKARTTPPISLPCASSTMASSVRWPRRTPRGSSATCRMTFSTATPTARCRIGRRSCATWRDRRRCRSSRAEDVRIRLFGPTAIVHGRTTYIKADGQPGAGRYTDVWARTGDGWLCVAADVTRC